ncbi:MAG: urate oxidase [Pirellulales bacterium]
MARLSADYYGKSDVRLTKVVRTGDLHTLHEFGVRLLLGGEFTRVYTDGDNASCVPTDTMKNTVYALAKSHEFDSPEAFGLILAKHFVDEFPHVAWASAEIDATRWERIRVDGEDHLHAFQIGGSGRRTVAVKTSRENGVSVKAGIAGLQVLKTTRSGFVGFIKDRYTTLPEVTDRIFATTINAEWDYGDLEIDFNATHDAALTAILEIFSAHDSLAVQQTIFAIGEEILARVPAVTTVSMTMPNQHRIPFNLTPLGLTNDNDIFVTTSEPYGLIHGTVVRD